MTEKTTYTAKQTGRDWPIYTGVYYDCHVVSIPQVLGGDLFRDWLTIVASPTISTGWQGMLCRQKLDSEIMRDEVLFGTFGVEKTFVDIGGDPEKTIEREVRENGYLICRVDSYYHPHFRNDYRQNHSPGHKVTVVDFDDQNFTILDNNGMHTSALTLERAEMIDSVLSNLYYSYDKQDTFYRLSGPSEDNAARLRPIIAETLQRTIAEFIANRAEVGPAIAALHAEFPAILTTAPEIRAYSWIRHVYKTALTVEFCYNALLETQPHVSAHWNAALPCSEDEFFAAIRAAAAGWKYLKMQCKTAEAEGKSAEYAPRLEKALVAITEREGKIADLLKIRATKQKLSLKGPRNWKEKLLGTKLLKSSLG